MEGFLGTQYVSMAKTWERPALAALKGTPLRYLEVGVFEGSGASWVLENVLTHPESRYVGVDPFILPADDGSPPDEVRRRCRANLERFGEKATVVVGQAFRVLADREFLEDFGGPFDVVFVDGSHHAFHVLQDSLAAWGVLKPGGVLVWDDYGFDHPRFASPRTQLGVDAFFAVLPARGFEVIERGGWQPAVRKLCDSVADRDDAVQ